MASGQLMKNAGKAAGALTSGFGKKTGKFLGDFVSGRWGRDIGEGFEEGFTGNAPTGWGATAGQTLARGGNLALGYQLLKNPIQNAYGKITGNEQKQPKVLTPEDKKWREGIASKATGGIVGDFQTKDLDSLSNNQDEGWRTGLKGIKKENYSKVVSEAIKSGDPTSIWNEVARASKAAGKNINVSNPLYLPQTFTRNGKQFAYAIDASETKKGKRPKFIPIEIGKGVNWGDDE
jgi:hypothetical protein